MRCKAVICGCTTVLGLLGVAMLAIGVIFYSEFDSIFGNTVREQMVIDDQVLWWYKVWMQPPVQETLTVHVFEVENAEELRQSIVPAEIPTRRARPKFKPQVREVGPFVFR